MKSKKATAHIIGASILILIVIMAGTIIFIWAKGFLSNPVLLSEAVGLSCPEVNIKAGLFQNQFLDVTNPGNTPLHGINVKISEQEDTTITPNEIIQTINPGESVSIDLQKHGISPQSGTKLIIVPIVIGFTDAGEIVHTCPDQYGEILEVS